MKNKITYNKLVRDKIPEIIQANQKHCKTYVTNQKEYKVMLLKKLVEEANEMLEDPCIEEYADILEVLESIKTSFDFKQDDINQVKEDKKNKRGGFSKGIVLEYVYEE